MLSMSAYMSLNKFLLLREICLRNTCASLWPRINPYDCNWV